VVENNVKLGVLFLVCVCVFQKHKNKFLRQKADRPTPKHRRQLTTWQVCLSSREEISKPGINREECIYVMMRWCQLCSFPEL
jgi:hypothetical protein